MLHNISSRSVRTIVLAGLAVVALLALPSAQAALAVDFTPDGNPKAYPDGAAATVPVKISWTCEEFLPSQDDITLGIEVTGGEGSATLDSSSVAQKAIVSECTPGQGVDATVNATVTATGGMVGELIEITVTATPPGDGEAVTNTFGVAVGPKVDVTFQANNTDMQLYGGENAQDSIMIISNSNENVMAMPSISEWPEGWNQPAVGPVTLDDPKGTGSLDFTVAVPKTAEPGTYNLVFSLFAHSLSEPSITTDTVDVMYTITVPEGAAPAMEGEEPEESPGLPALVPVALLGALAVALRRRD